MSIWRVVAVFGGAPATIFLLVTAAAYAPAWFSRGRGAEREQSGARGSEEGAHSATAR